MDLGGGDQLGSDGVDTDDGADAGFEPLGRAARPGLVGYFGLVLSPDDRLEGQGFGLAFGFLRAEVIEEVWVRVIFVWCDWVHVDWLHLRIWA